MHPEAMAPVNANATRTAIMDAATTLFLEKGVAGTSVSSIARVAGVTKSLIHHHFETKDKLWTAVRNRLLEEYAEVQAQVLRNADSPTIELFIESFANYFRFLARRKEIVVMVTMFNLEQLRGDEVPTSSELTMGHQLFQLGVDVVNRAQNNGMIRTDLSPSFIMLLGCSMAENWFLRKQWVCECAGDDMPEDSGVQDEWFIDQLSAFLRQGFAPLPEL